MRQFGQLRITAGLGLAVYCVAGCSGDSSSAAASCELPAPVTSIVAPENLLFIPTLAVAFVITFPDNAANVSFSEDLKKRALVDSGYRTAMTGVIGTSQMDGPSTVFDFIPEATDEDVCAAFNAIQPELNGAKVVFVRRSPAP